MLLNEIFHSSETLLNEYGYRGFGGYGQSFFRRAHYVAMANLCRSELPAAVRGSVEQWFAQIFAKDNPAFKPEQFLKACETGASNASAPTWQQRHFYYLAECITNIPAEPMREFIATFLADYFSRQSGNFMKKRWYEYCKVPDPDATEQPKRIGGRR
jgi:hypothetical protein